MTHASPFIRTPCVGDGPRLAELAEMAISYLVRGTRAFRRGGNRFSGLL